MKFWIFHHKNKRISISTNPPREVTPLDTVEEILGPYEALTLEEAHKLASDLVIVK